MSSNVDEFMVAVKMTLDADNLFSAGIAAAAADEVQSGLGAGGAEADFFGAGKRSADEGREFFVIFGLKGVQVSKFNRLCYGPVYFRMSKTEEAGSVSAAHVDILPSLNVPYSASFAS
jgi:hypothetical protein